MASTKITRTPSSVGNSKTWTYSMWIKLGNIGTEYVLFHNYGSSNTSEVYAKIGGSSGVIEFALRYSGTYEGRLITNRLFRDPSAWYHLVFTCDTTSATATNRQRIYVNGVEETSFSTDTQITQNAGTVFNQAHEHTIGSYGSGNYFDGEMAHVHMIDGTAYPASTFGETDSTSGIWKPKTAPSVTYGTNGFFLKFENSGNMDLDSSGNNLTFATSGTLTQNTDTPTNNYATLTPLYTIEYNSAQFFTNGNNTTNSNTTQWNTNPCTMEVSSGKWYFEGYGHTNGSNYVHYGITSSAKMNANATQAQAEINTNSNGYAYGYYGTNGSIYYSTTSASSSTSYGNSYGSTDYIGIFADLDNNKLYFAKNGTLQNSGTGYDISADGKPYILATAVYSGLTNVNFGSGVFGTTALTGTTYADANGHGTFKYSPNQGGAANFDSAAKNFYAMNTKNLKEFG